VVGVGVTNNVGEADGVGTAVRVTEATGNADGDGTAVTVAVSKAIDV
jgi:hypothetical protein